MNGDPTLIMCEAMLLISGIFLLFQPEERAVYRHNRFAGAAFIVIAVCHGVPDIVHFIAAK